MAVSSPLEVRSKVDNSNSNYYPPRIMGLRDPSKTINKKSKAKDYIFPTDCRFWTDGAIDEAATTQLSD